MNVGLCGIIHIDALVLVLSTNDKFHYIMIFFWPKTFNTKNSVNHPVGEECGYDQGIAFNFRVIFLYNFPGQVTKFRSSPRLACLPFIHRRPQALHN